MSEKTKYSRWLPWGIVVTVVIGIGMLSGMLHWGWLTTPWSLAQFVSREVSIAYFQSVDPDVGAFWPERWQALAGLIVLFVVGPSLWIWSEIRNEENENPIKKGITWYVGAIIVILGLVTGVLGSTVEAIVFQNTQESAAISKHEDSLRGQLGMLAFDAVERYHQLRSLGGGDGSFRGIQAGDTVRAIQLPDLESYGNTDPETEFVLKKVESDSTITIYGIGQKKGGDPNFENANGETGKVQISITITPSTEDMFTIIGDNIH